MLARQKRFGKKLLRPQSLMVATVVLVPIVLYVNGPGYRLALPYALNHFTNSYGYQIICDVEGSIIGKTELRNVEVRDIMGWSNYRPRAEINADYAQIEISWPRLLFQPEKFKWLKKLTLENGEIESLEAIIDDISNVSTNPYDPLFFKLLSAEINCHFNQIYFYSETEITNVLITSKRKNSSATITIEEIKINRSSTKPIVVASNKTIPLQWDKQTHTFTSALYFPEWGIDSLSISQKINNNVNRTNIQTKIGDGNLNYETTAEIDSIQAELSISTPILIENIQLVDIIYQVIGKENPGWAGTLLPSTLSVEGYENPASVQIQCAALAKDLRYGKHNISDVEISWSGNDGRIQLSQPDIQLDIEAQAPVSDPYAFYDLDLTLTGEIKISEVAKLINDFDLPLSLSGPLDITFADIQITHDGIMHENAELNISSNQLKWKNKPFEKSQFEWINGFANGEFTCIDSLVFKGNPTTKSQTFLFKSNTPAWMPELIATDNKLFGSEQPSIHTWDKVYLSETYTPSECDFSVQCENLILSIPAQPHSKDPYLLTLNSDCRGNTKGLVSNTLSILLRGTSITAAPTQGNLTITGKNLSYNYSPELDFFLLHPFSFSYINSGAITFDSDGLTGSDYDHIIKKLQNTFYRVPHSK